MTRPINKKHKSQIGKFFMLCLLLIFATIVIKFVKATSFLGRAQNLSPGKITSFITEDLQSGKSETQYFLEESDGSKRIVDENTALSYANNQATSYLLPSRGAHRVAVIRVYFSNLSASSPTTPQVSSLINGQLNSY